MHKIGINRVKSDHNLHCQVKLLDTIYSSSQFDCTQYIVNLFIPFFEQKRNNEQVFMLHCTICTTWTLFLHRVFVQYAPMGLRFSVSVETYPSVFVFSLNPTFLHSILSNPIPLFLSSLLLCRKKHKNCRTVSEKVCILYQSGEAS